MSRLSFLLCLPALFSCVDLGPQPAPVVRWLSAEPELREPSTKGGPGVLLEVTAASHLDQRVTWRKGEVEHGFYELLRWTEPPAEYLRRALVNELHVADGRFPKRNGTDVRLAADFVAFEEDWVAGERRARARIDVRFDGFSGIEVYIVELEEPIEGAEPTDLARALRALLSRAARSIADRTST